MMTPRQPMFNPATFGPTRVYTYPHVAGEIGNQGTISCGMAQALPLYDRFQSNMYRPLTDVEAMLDAYHYANEIMGVSADEDFSNV